MNEKARGVQIDELGYRHMKHTAVVIQLSPCILIKLTVIERSKHGGRAREIEDAYKIRRGIFRKVVT
jgi:hypothetical protein